MHGILRFLPVFIIMWSGIAQAITEENAQREFAWRTYQANASHTGYSPFSFDLTTPPSATPDLSSQDVGLYFHTDVHNESHRLIQFVSWINNITYQTQQASGTIYLSGTSGSVDTITVDGADIMSGAESYSNDIGETASNIVANINLFTTEYIAELLFSCNTCGSFTLEAGDIDNKVELLNVDGVEIISSTITLDTTLDNFATDIANNISAHTSDPDYDAVAVGSIVIISPVGNETIASNFVVDASDTLVSRSITNMDGFTAISISSVNQQAANSNGDLVDNTTNITTAGDLNLTTATLAGADDATSAGGSTCDGGIAGRLIPCNDPPLATNFWTPDPVLNQLTIADRKIFISNRGHYATQGIWVLDESTFSISRTYQHAHPNDVFGGMDFDINKGLWPDDLCPMGQSQASWDDDSSSYFINQNVFSVSDTDFVCDWSFHSSAYSYVKQYEIPIQQIADGQEGNVTLIDSSRFHAMDMNFADEYLAPTIFNSQIFTGGGGAILTNDTNGELGGVYAFEANPNLPATNLWAENNTNGYFSLPGHNDRFTPAVDSSRVVVYSRKAGNSPSETDGAQLSIIDRSTGQLVFSINDPNYRPPVPNKPFHLDSAPVLTDAGYAILQSNGVINFEGDEQGRLIGFDLQNTQTTLPTWVANGDFRGQPSVAGNAIYVLAATGQAGTPEDTTDDPITAIQALNVLDGSEITATDGSAWKWDSIDCGTGENVACNATANLLAPFVVTDSHVFVSNDAGETLAISRSGTPTAEWFTDQASGHLSMVLDSLYIADNAGKTTSGLVEGYFANTTSSIHRFNFTMDSATIMDLFFDVDGFSATPATVQVGEPTTLSMTVNSDPEKITPSQFTTTTTLPDGIILVEGSMDSRCTSFTSGEEIIVECTGTSLPSTFTYDVFTITATDYFIIVEVDGEGPDGGVIFDDVSNNNGTAITLTGTAADANVELSLASLSRNSIELIGANTLPEATQTTANFLIRPLGTDISRGLFLTGAVNENVTLLSVSVPGAAGDCSASTTSVINCSLNDLDPSSGDTVTLTVVAQSALEGQASIDLNLSSYSDSDLSNNDVSVTFDVVAGLGSNTLFTLATLNEKDSGSLHWLTLLVVSILLASRKRKYLG